MGFWNELRASGVNLSERYCINCKTRKHRSLFPKHQRYKKSRTCFECLGEIKCRTCNELKSYEEFIDQHKGARKSKVECWECYTTRTKAKKRKSYQRRKKEGTLPVADRSKIKMHSHLWAKISGKKHQKNSERSSEVNLTAEEFRDWFKKNYDECCYYCGVNLDQYRSSAFLKKIRPHIKNFGIDRKDTTKGYDVNNIVVACNLCNSVKGSFFNDEEFKEIGKKYIRKLYD